VIGDKRKAIRQIFCCAGLASGTGQVVLTANDTKTWPNTAVEKFLSAKLIKSGVPCSSIICDGCEEQCLRPIELMGRNDSASMYAISTCNKYEDLGPFFYQENSLATWMTSRELIADFFSRELSLECKSTDVQCRRIRFQTITTGSIRRGVSLEFSARPLVNIGDAVFELESFVTWDGQGIHIDIQHFMECVHSSGERRSGDKPYQPSGTIQEHKKMTRELRNCRLQSRLEGLARENRNLSKEQLVSKIVKEEAFSDMSAGTVLRVTRMPKRQR